MSKYLPIQKKDFLRTGVSPFALTICVIIVGIIWFSISDRIIEQISTDVHIISIIQTIKDIIFIVFVSIIIYALSNNYVKSVRKNDRASLILQEERTRMVERLSGSIAHDINNPLLIIRGNSELIIELSAKEDSKNGKIIEIFQKILDLSNILEEETFKDELNIKNIHIKIDTVRNTVNEMMNTNTVKKHPSQEIKVAAETIMQGCDRISQTIQRLSHLNLDNNIQEFDLKEPIITAVTLTRAQWLKVCKEIKLKFPDRTKLLMKGVESDFVHIFINLINNAVQAIDKAGQISIIVTPIDGMKRIVVEVIDTGHGIEPGILHQLGKQRVTTKPIKNGVGLGLLRVTEMVRQNNGEISFQSGPGKGTIVRIELPLEK